MVKKQRQFIVGTIHRVDADFLLRVIDGDDNHFIAQIEVWDLGPQCQLIHHFLHHFYKQVNCLATAGGEHSLTYNEM